MDELVNLYAAYAIIWAGLFLYMLKLHLDAGRVQRDIQNLREALDARRR